MRYNITPIIGQEAICPDGLGRVIAFNYELPDLFVQVDTYINNRGCMWAPTNVALIPPGQAIKIEELE